jgi:hypothetical protein
LSAFKKFKNERPTESDYAKIGRIALQHTGLEYQIEALIWTYFGDTDKGHVATAKMGMTQKIEALKTLVEWTEPDDGIADAIEWAIKCFEVVRDNRNSVVHGYNFKADQSSGKLFIEKRKPGMVFDSHLQFEITPGVLAGICNEQMNLSSYIYLLQKIIDRRGPESIGPGIPAPSEPSPLPNRCALPSSLDPLPHQAPESTRRQRKSLQEMEAKAAKAKRKDEQREAQKKKSQ